MKRSPVRTPKTLADLRLDEGNANRGTDRGRALLAESLQQYGPGRSILIDRVGRVLAGNKTVEHARALGLPIKLVRTNGDALVIVQRDDLEDGDPRARALAIADNRVAELDLDWDPAVLQQLQASGLTLATWWTDAEWAAVLESGHIADPAEDRVLAPGPTTIQRGDVFALGPHRVACGDATQPADVRQLLGAAKPRLMVTDAPYGVAYAPRWRSQVNPRQRTAVGPVLNDDTAAWPAAYALFPGDVIYAWHASTRTVTVAESLLRTGFELRAQIVWVKQHYALSRGHYHFGHEPCWYAVRRGGSAHWQGDRTQSTVWTVPNLNAMGGTRTDENTPTGHSTQKPVRLFEIPMRNHTTAGEAVYDPFVGSGTALIAAQKTGRIAYVMDVDPQYVQVALTRWETYTGQTATRLGGAVAARRRR
jgi:DNA modification methylase